jgi:hypothetical protein
LGSALFLLLTSITPALGLECPQPQPKGGRSIIRETPRRIAEFGRMLITGDSGNAVTEIIYYLRHKHPRASRGDITNFLITAYCPVIRAQGYPDEVAANKVSAFAALVEDRLYRSR